jgi:ABC-type glutathione transport system ATPase component
VTGEPVATAADAATAGTASAGGGAPDRPALVLRDLRKSIGSAIAVDGIELEVRRGEFVTLLGPSGSG